MPEHWSGTERADGLRVFVGPDGEWIVVPRDEYPALGNFASKHDAMQAADATFPLKAAA